MKKLDLINIGQTPNDQKGDPHRVAFDRINQNFSAIGASIDLLEAYALAKPLIAVAGTDLDTLTDSGWYYQNNNVRAAAGKNYPVPYAGLLLVWNTADMRYQVYISYGAGTAVTSMFFWRNWYGNRWTDWSRAVSDTELKQVRALAEAAIPAAQKGVANGVATLAANGQIPPAQIPALYAPTLPVTAHDLNASIVPGVYYQATDAGVAAGANYPVARVGFLEVAATGTPVLQVYTARGDTPATQSRFWRVRMSVSSWSPWKEMADVAGVKADLAGVKAASVPYQGLMPTGADLNTYRTRGRYVVSGSSTASGGQNYPVANAGHLDVLSAAGDGESSNSGQVQVYQALNASEMYIRSLLNGTWSPWKKLASLDDLTAAAAGYMKHVLLSGNGVDLNSYYAGENYYTWNASATMTNGLNFPPCSGASGTLYVSATSASAVAQTVVVNANSPYKPRIFTRWGNGTTGVWGVWKCIGSVSVVSHLPVADAGDVYVDGLGWFAWDATAPAGYYLRQGQRTVRQVVSASGALAIPAHVRRVFVQAIGGGGGGAHSDQGVSTTSSSFGSVHLCTGGGGGGGAGEYFEGFLDITPGTVLSITIGAGGTTGAATTDANEGGQTVIKQGTVTLKALRGGGGAGRASHMFGGVAGRNGGNAGSHGATWLAGISGYGCPPGNGGNGAPSPFGFGGTGGMRSGSVNQPGSAGEFPAVDAWGAGGGGGGGSLAYGSGTYAGGASGRSGVVIVEY